MIPHSTLSTDLLSLVDHSRISLAPMLSADPAKRSELGQFFTPASIAAFMADMIQENSERQSLRILDAGAGNGMLTAAAVSRILSMPSKPREIIASTWELDPTLTPNLERTLERCGLRCREQGVRFIADFRRTDFIRDAVTALNSALFNAEFSQYDLAILNPPYRKLNSETQERLLLRSVGIETSNLYAAFVWLACKLLAQGGQLVAITPRSYMNGSYFKPFRQALLREMSFNRVHVYESRDKAFLDDDVLQENAIISAFKGVDHQSVSITTSEGPDDEGCSSIMVSPSQFVLPDDADQVMHVVVGENEAAIGTAMRSLPESIHDLGLRVSTGRIVDFRARERLRGLPSPGDVPMILPGHLVEGFVSWPADTVKKPQAFKPREEDDPDVLPSGWYVVVKRFSAKEEKRRIVAALVDPARLPSSGLAFDNKLNVIHKNGAGLPAGLAKGLALFLNSTIVDSYFRQFSGHTQVNAADLRSIRLPNAPTLEQMGRHVNGHMPPPDRIDDIIREEIPDMAKGKDLMSVKKKIDHAIDLLGQLQAPKAQCNERSALTLLALLDLAPNAGWAGATDPRRGVTEIMDWMAERYRKHYAPNTRETIRRFTLHQFIEMGLVVLNPDDSTRTPNSPKNVYQIEPSALQLLRTFGTDGWSRNLSEYLASAEGRNRLRESARLLTQVPVALPDGHTLQLSPGGQNVLVKEIIEQFAPRFTPGGRVLYVGDAGEKHLLNDAPYLAGLGVAIDRHGKMPDVVIHYLEKNWLVLVEAVTSHGPVNLLRHNQLKALFAGSRAGLVFVTAFLDRKKMREYLPDIAWETEVWAADAPSHLIHFNGSRFLGPYPG